MQNAEVQKKIESILEKATPAQAALILRFAKRLVEE